MTVTVVTTSTSEKKRREPLKAIDMAPSQVQARPASASNGSGRGRRGRPSAQSSSKQEANNEDNAMNGEKKRKAADYNEDVEGFQFTRLATKKPKPTMNTIPEIPPPVPEEQQPAQRSPRRGRPPKKKGAKVTESAAAEVEVQTRSTRTTTRRTRRTSALAAEPEAEARPESPPRNLRKRDPPPDPLPVEKKKKRKGRPSKSKDEPKKDEPNGFVSPEPQQPGTSKIALPLADTPVIQRNKEMRGRKSEKRRSSLGMRGRRASSLIDSGASNALPHKEVDTADFYKHIASDGLSEPRRMRQLLIWCATRAMGDKPSGSRSEDESARLAARVIQEELLKDFANISELSNWFAREDVSPPTVVVKKPNPKNIQNTEKIKELEEQIQRLQRERRALNDLLRPPSIPRITPPKQPSETEAAGQQNPQPSQPGLPLEPQPIDTSLLEPSQQAIFASLQPAIKKSDQSMQTDTQSSVSASETSLPPITPAAISTRLSRLTTSLAPTLDSLAAGIHDIELYRTTADTVSSEILRICAQRLEERDARNALRSLSIEGDEDSKDLERGLLRRERPREDIGIILGALSRVERR